MRRKLTALLFCSVGELVAQETLADSQVETKAPVLQLLSKHDLLPENYGKK